jgi:hypothetical protein
MTAAGLVAFFSLLSAASEGAGHSLKGTVAMLSFCRSVYFSHAIILPN